VARQQRRAVAGVVAAMVVEERARVEEPVPATDRAVARPQAAVAAVAAVDVAPHRIRLHFRRRMVSVARHSRAATPCRS
jgi:hypothetical protein